MIGILLAGGRAERLGGGDKGQHIIGDATILDHITRRLRPQCKAIVINANGDLGRFAATGLPVVADDCPARLGPLAGVLASLEYVATNYPRARFVVTVPTDAPFLPTDLVARFVDAQLLDNAQIVCARSDQKQHPLTALWSLALRDDLKAVLREDSLPSVSAFMKRHAFAYADWPIAPFDPFFNVNTREDLEKARGIYASSIEPGSA